MATRFWSISLYSFFISFWVSPAFAQSDSLRVAVANLSQDMQLLEQQVKTLRLEIEEMRRENMRLRSKLTKALSSQNNREQISNLAQAVEAVRQDFRSADEALKSEIISEVTRQLTTLAEETQEALNAVAEVIGEQPQVSAPIHFSEDYPKSGITYTVRSGDTLSKIARIHGSTVKYIQNANQIVNPSKDLQVGQTIFIPISE